MERTTASISSVLESLALKRAELTGRLEEIEIVMKLLTAAGGRTDAPAAPRPARPARPARPPRASSMPSAAAPRPLHATPRKTASRPKRDTIEEILSTEIIAHMDAHGDITGAQLQDIKKTRYIGAIISGWKRSCSKLGLDFDQIIESHRDDAGENHYTLTKAGRELIDKTRSGTARPKT